jgi:carbamoyl-phosphate synthase small subunit
VAAQVQRSPGLLVLEDGRVFRGNSFGASGSAFGEAVFTTGMSGYQETLTDPSYQRQIVVMTAPHVGNTGMNDEDEESRRIWVSGFVVRDPSRIASNWRSQRTLNDDLEANGIVGVSDIDTRALTRHLRDRGAMRAGVFAGADAQIAAEELIAAVQASPAMAGADLSSEVTTDVAYTIPAKGRKRFRVAAIDLGIKAMTPEMMAERGIEVVVMPASTTVSELGALELDGLFLSNGPGDPATADGPVELVRWALGRQLPVFGICFGNQILARALGYGTYKLRFGHRGINQPVMDLTTGKVEITSQNHGFCVIPESLPENTEVTHVSLFDGINEGLRCTDKPAFSVQYHPEASPGPTDSHYLFDRFVEMIDKSKGK